MGEVRVHSSPHYQSGASGSNSHAAYTFVAVGGHSISFADETVTKSIIKSPSEVKQGIGVVPSVESSVTQDLLNNSKGSKGLTLSRRDLPRFHVASIVVQPLSSRKDEMYGYSSVPFVIPGVVSKEVVSARGGPQEKG
ncbi:hypothetical protein INT47_006913 [Mucor saturninus]|uniref:Uncharacterized protein n=1 Tax=Mucor saturninus TaxID=64648 RepID=A0A8H7QIC1_9FUNG|nr:hypothetical protein INT47_006913 [Mucor saturninus]